MKSIDGVILEATLAELANKFWDEEYFKIMTWETFLDNVKRQGATIIGDIKNEDTGKG